jgi:hypothetical protein
VIYGLFLLIAGCFEVNGVVLLGLFAKGDRFRALMSPRGAFGDKFRSLAWIFIPCDTADAASPTRYGRVSARSAL